MKRRNATRNALLMSVLSMLLCVSMLVGTTFAWFTDSVTNGHNIIRSGNLDISLWHNSCANSDLGFGYDEATGEEVLAETDLFLNLDGEEILWEPGAVGTDTFRIKNDGTLALKYAFTIKAYNATETADGHDLTEVLNVSAAEFDYNEYGTPFTPADGYFDETGKMLEEGYTIEGSLLPGESVDYWMWLHWIPTDHDNDYNVKGGLKLDLCVELVATQFTYEVDSYNGDQYDASAALPAGSPIIAGSAEEANGYVNNGLFDDTTDTSKFFSVVNQNLSGDACIILDDQYPTVVLENVSAYLNGDAIIVNKDNTIILQNCNFNLPEGAKLIKAGDAFAGQVMMCNVTVNGVVLEGTSYDNALIAELVDCSGFVQAVVETE